MTLQAQYLFNSTTLLSDTGPNSHADVTAFGAGGIVARSNLTFNAGYYGDENANRFESPTGVAPNVGAGDWTLRCRAVGLDWDGLSSVQNGILTLSVGNSGAAPRVVFRTANVDDDFVLTVNNGTTGVSVDSGQAAVNGTSKYFSATRQGANIHFHIDGVYIGSGAIGADTEFDFSSCTLNGCADYHATSGINGWVAEVEFWSEALYTTINYTPPTAESYAEPTSEAALPRAWGFELDNHSFYPLRLGQTGTWVYDLWTQQWAQWQTDSSPIWNAVHGVTLWNNYVVCADQETSTIYRLDPDIAQDEGSLPITCTVAGILKNRERDWLQLGELRLSASVGAPYIDGAAVTLRWSDDQGQSYSTPITFSLSNSDNLQSVRWRYLGSFASPLRIFEISDVGGLARINGCDVEII